MRKKLTHAFAAALAVLLITPAFADGPGEVGRDVAAPPVRAEPPAPVAQPAAEGRSGQIAYDEITLTIPQGYRFYSAEEAYAYMQRNNATAPDGVVYGLIARAGDDIRRPGTWATVVSYDAIGYVQAETASGLADEGFEAQVAQARGTQNRVFEGFAAAPAFADSAPSLVWAERSGRPGATGADMRFEQKFLGRHGVACLTAIGAADQLPAMQAAAPELAAMLSFPSGARHADFAPASDNISAYSVPGLVTGLPAAQPIAAAAASDAGGQTGFGGLSGVFPWVAVGVIVLAIGGYLLMRRRRDEDELEQA